MPLTKVQAEGINLADTFAFTGTVSGTGGMDLLSTQTASDSTGIIFDNSLITDTYDNYLLIGSRISPATNATNPLLFYSIDNGSNFNLSLSSARHYLRLQGAASGHEQENTSDSSQRIGTSSSSTTVETCQFYTYFQGFRSNTQKSTHGVYTGTHSGGTSDGYSWRHAARIVATSPINYVKFDFSSGNFDGVLSLYGMRS